MDKSIYTFSLGEKEITLKFTWGGIKKLKGILNADPLTAFTKLSDTTDTAEFALNVIVACSDMKRDEVDQLVENELPGNVVNVTIGVIKAFNNAFGIDEVGGEADKNTQEPKAA